MRPEEIAENAPGKLIAAPEGHWAYVPDPLPPELELDLATINLLAEAERSLGELKGVSQRLPNPRLLTAPFQRREAVLSSRIEGTTAGLQQLLLFESSPTAESEQSDVLEVANYLNALAVGLRLLDEMPISLRLIREVHGLLLAGVRGHESRPGEFRQSGVVIGRPGSTPATARFVPPPAMEMRQALHDLERFVGARQSNLPFLIQLALVHYQFEAIHPFMDGNGRVGRLLIALQLQEHAYLPHPLLYLSAYLERHRQDYYDRLLAVSRSGAWIEWIDFFLQAILEQAADTAQRSDRLLTLHDRYREWALSTSRSGNLLRIVDLVFQQPVISVANVGAFLQVTPPAANRLVAKMVDDGIVIEVTGQKRHRRFAAPEILAIINPDED
jgi:Fic family protein